MLETGLNYLVFVTAGIGHKKTDVSNFLKTMKDTDGELQENYVAVEQGALTGFLARYKPTSESDGQPYGRIMQLKNNKQLRVMSLKTINLRSSRLLRNYKTARLNFAEIRQK